MTVMSNAFTKSHPAAIADFIQNLENLGDFAAKTLLSDIPAAIRGADKRIAKMLQKLDVGYAEFNGDKNAVFSSEYLKYKSLLTGSQSLMLQHAKAVEFQRSAKGIEAVLIKNRMFYRSCWLVSVRKLKHYQQKQHKMLGLRLPELFF